MTEARWSGDDRREIADMIKDIDICMFVTRSNGSVRGRPMSNNRNVEYDGDSWFFSYRDTPKVDEIEADPHVELAYIATDRGTWVSIEGVAEIVEDDEKKKALWDKQLEGWFQEGPEDDDVILLKVRAERVHAWANDEEIIGEPGKPLERVREDR
jgi:general stress protein 26